MSRIWIPVLALALSAALPELAHACPVCFDASDENRRAFVATTVLLSLLPLGMVTGAGLWPPTGRPATERRRASDS
jgi:hypothetical protein